MMLRSFFLFLIGLFLPIFLSLSVFSSSTISQTKYPPEYVEEYVIECTGDRGFVVEAVCRCIARKAQEEYLLEDFQRINQESEETGKISDDQLLKIINDCDADPFS